MLRSLFGLIGRLLAGVGALLAGLFKGRRRPRYPRAVKGVVDDAVTERAAGGRPDRLRSLVAAMCNWGLGGAA